MTKFCIGAALLSMFAMPASAAVSGDPRHLRQCPVPQSGKVPADQGLPDEVGPSRAIALPADAGAGDKPDRAGVVAFARGDHAQPSMSNDG